jgi:hypothetical protein
LISVFLDVLCLLLLLMMMLLEAGTGVMQHKRFGRKVLLKLLFLKEFLLLHMMRMTVAVTERASGGGGERVGETEFGLIL